MSKLSNSHLGDEGNSVVFGMRKRDIVLVVILIVVIAVLLTANILRFPAWGPSVSDGTFYLDANHPKAEDSADGGSVARPWKTLHYAFRQLRPGDTLLIRGGIYRELRWIALDEGHTGREDAPITVQAYPGETVVIQGSRPISFNGADWWTVEGLVFESPYQDSHHIQLGLHEALGQDRTVAAIHITIRNCEFRNGTETIISVNYAKHVLIEKNYFHHVRPGIPFDEGGWEINAIGIRYAGDDIVIKGNRFEDIGSDGVHLGAQGYLEGSNIGAVSILSNEFWVNRPYEGILGNVGENGIDVKWVKGPVLISGNHIHGFRPTTSEQDASGADGAAIIIHDNAQNVIVESNHINDNTRHVVVSRGTDGTSSGTTDIVIRDNLLLGAKNDVAHEGVAILIRDVGTVSIRGNTMLDTDDAYYLRADVGGHVEFAENIVIGGRAGGDMNRMTWAVQGNIWRDGTMHPLLGNREDAGG